MSKVQAATKGLWIAFFIAACSSGGSDTLPLGDDSGGNAGTAEDDGEGGRSKGSGDNTGGKASNAGGKVNGNSSGGAAGRGKGGTTDTGSGGKARNSGGAGGNSNDGGKAGGAGTGSGGRNQGTGGKAGNPDVGGGKAGADADGGSSGTGGKQTGGTQGEGGNPGNTGGTNSGTGGKNGNVNTTGDGPRYPFPQNVKYPYGVQSTKITNEHVKSWYDNWKKKNLVTCNGNLMPAADSASVSKVEVQGFAMVAVAYMGEKDVFDKLYNYYKSKTSAQGCGLMGWKNNCGGVEDAGAATDGDIDVASGLVVAHWQWPNDGYDKKAKDLLTNLKKMTLECDGKTTVYPGCSGGRPWGGCNETDISYYSPAFFRYFAKISGDEAWTKLANDTHTIRDAAANNTTGLVPDWQSVSGTAGAGSRVGTYGFDAIRTPYKQALDYLWNGNEKALAWCKKISSWAYGVGVKNLKDGYQLNGTATGANHNLATVGSLAVCALANTQEIADAFVQESVNIKDDYWYSSYLGNLYLLAMSGNMWTPDIIGE